MMSEAERDANYRRAKELLLKAEQALDSSWGKSGDKLAPERSESYLRLAQVYLDIYRHGM